MPSHLRFFVEKRIGAFGEGWAGLQLAPSASKMCVIKAKFDAVFASTDTPTRDRYTCTIPIPGSSNVLKTVSPGAANIVHTHESISLMSRDIRMISKTVIITPRI